MNAGNFVNNAVILMALLALRHTIKFKCMSHCSFRHPNYHSPVVFLRYNLLYLDVQYTF